MEDRRIKISGSVIELDQALKDFISDMPFWSYVRISDLTSMPKKQVAIKELLKSYIIGQIFLPLGYDVEFKSNDLEFEHFRKIDWDVLPIKK